MKGGRKGSRLNIEFYVFNVNGSKYGVTNVYDNRPFLSNQDPGWVGLVTKVAQVGRGQVKQKIANSFLLTLKETLSRLGTISFDVIHIPIMYIIKFVDLYQNLMTLVKFLGIRPFSDEGGYISD